MFSVLIQQVSGLERTVYRIGFEIYHYNDKRVGEDNNKPKLVGVGKYSAERVVTLSSVLDKGKYVVVLSTYEPRKYGRFTFTVWYHSKNDKGVRNKIELKKLNK